MRALAAVVIAAVVPAGTALAQRAAAAPQAGRPCTVQVDSIARFAQRGSNYFGGGGVYMHCQNDPSVTMSSDSLAYYSSIGELQMFGNVRFRDSASTLDADRASYWTRQERLYAQGNVYTRSLVSGSDMRGPNLDYYRAKAGIRDTVEIRGTGRPTINFYPKRDTLRTRAADDTTRPFVVVADRVRMLGNDRMWGGGRVTIDRLTLHATADSAHLDLAADRGTLLGSPVVSDTGEGSYRLLGRRIDFGLTRDDEIDRVLAQDSADAYGPNWHLAGDTLDLDIDSNRVQRAQAWGDRRRATAVSERNTITADSLDILMPRQVVSLVWGFGDGHALTAPDTTAPDSEPDWLRGDTLRARFGQRTVRDTVAGRDTTRERTEIQYVTAFGQARAYYHVDNEREEGGPRGVSYSRGRRIDIALNESKVRTVDIVGAVDGVYLEPFTRAERDSATADSARADSLRAGRPVGEPGATPPPPRPRDDYDGRAETRTAFSVRRSIGPSLRRLPGYR